MQEREPVGRRLRRFLVLMLGLFAIGAGIVITQRLSDDALALLIGLICGVLVLLPMLILLVFMWRRQESRRLEEERRAPQNAAPPVVVVTPSLPPGYANQRQAGYNEQLPWTPSRSERKFTIVGGEED